MEGSGAVVAGLQLAILLTDGTVVFMLQIVLVPSGKVSCSDNVKPNVYALVQTSRCRLGWLCFVSSSPASLSEFLPGVQW